MRERVQQRVLALRGAEPEHGGIVLGWLTKLVVVFGLASIFLFEAISLGVTSMSLADQGSAAAREASEEWQRSGDVQRAYEVAVSTAKAADPDNVVDNTTFRIDQDNTVHLRLSRTATTLLLYRWGKTADWAVIERDARGRSVA